MGAYDHWSDRATLERWNSGRDLGVSDRHCRHDFQHTVHSRDGKHCTYSVRYGPSTAIHNKPLTTYSIVVANITGSASSHPINTNSSSLTSRGG